MKKIMFISLIIAAFTMLQSCNFEMSTASIAEVKTCHELEGSLCSEGVNVFHPNSPLIFCSCKLSYAPPQTEVKFIWKYVEGSEDIIIDELVFNTEDQGSNLDLQSNLSRPNNGWPLGKYAVDIMIGSDESSIKTAEFEVR